MIDLIKIFTWIDEVYAVNLDMKSQTGGVTLMEIGVSHAKRSNERLNVKSSTEAELGEVSEYIPYNIWLLLFMSKQEYEIKDNELYQDNRNTTLMLNNGRKSCTGKSRKIYVIYFFVKDKINN